MAYPNLYNYKTTSIYEMRGQLVELILDMSEAETEELLEELNHRRTSNNEEKDRRKNPRKRTFIHIDCSGNKCAFTDFVQNISVGGLYIETQLPLSVDQELSMSFFLSDNETPIKNTGSIVRIDEKGIGIQFSKPLVGV